MIQQHEILPPPSGITKAALRLKDDELASKTLEAKELASQLYNDRQTIAILEDRLRDLNFSLHQKNTELASIKTMAAVRADGQDRESTELKEKVGLNKWYFYCSMQNITHRLFTTYLGILS